MPSLPKGIFYSEPECEMCCSKERIQSLVRPFRLILKKSTVSPSSLPKHEKQCALPIAGACYTSPTIVVFRPLFALMQTKPESSAAHLVLRATRPMRLARINDVRLLDRAALPGRDRENQADLGVSNQSCACSSVGNRRHKWVGGRWPGVLLEGIAIHHPS